MTVTKSVNTATGLMTFNYNIPDALLAAYGGAVWDALTAAHGVAGSFGLLIRTNLDATVSSRARPADILSDGNPFAGANIDATISSRATQAQILSDLTPFPGADVPAIRAVTDGIPTLTQTGGTIATTGAVQDIYIDNAPSAAYRPMCLQIDFTNQTATETVVIKEYYRIRNGGNLILKDIRTFSGLVSPQLIEINLAPNRYGFEITIEKTQGTNRTYDWEIWYKAV